MKLYGFAPSPNTWKVRAVAAHIGVPLEYESVDLFQPRTADYLALNPSGRTPTLVDGNFVLSEALAIMQYVADQKPNTLWPKGTRERAEIMRWQSWQIQHWHKEACEPLLVERLIKGLLNMGPPDAANVENALAAFNREARLLDGHLASRCCRAGARLRPRRLPRRREKRADGEFRLSRRSSTREWTATLCLVVES
jgi:glutathione S-transferase